MSSPSPEPNKTDIEGNTSYFNPWKLGCMMVIGLFSWWNWPSKPKKRNVAVVAHKPNHSRHSAQLSHTHRTHNLIQQAFSNPPDTVIAVHPKQSLSVKVSDLCTLKNGEWLNDEVINFYLTLLMDVHQNQRVLFMNSFFYTKLTENGYNYNNVKRWTRTSKLRKRGIMGINNIFEMDKIIFPIHVGKVHWCCGCINVKNKQFEYYDSMHGSPRFFFKVMRKYLVDEYNDKIVNGNNASNYNCVFNINEWRDSDEGNRYPQQYNGYDCGVFTLKCAAYIAHDLYPNFSQHDMQFFRQQIMTDIIGLGGVIHN